MSQYSIAVSWSGKDALADSDTNKIISGGDFNTEFSAVRIAVNSKADLNGSASESFSATTAAVGTNTTQVATTAFVKDVLENYIYPVGSIYMNMAVATNPGTLLGFGTWVAYATGQVLVGYEASGTFDLLDESLGAETHTLTTDEIPSHNHSNGGYDRLLRVTTGGNQTVPSPDTTGGEPDVTSSAAISAAGGGSAHNNLQPSVTVHMWKRTV